MTEQNAGITEEIAYPRRRKPVWSALRFRSYRIIISGFVLANIGHWMQLTTVAWIIVHTSASNLQGLLWLAALTIAQIVPALILVPVAGVVAGFFPRKTVLWNSNAVAALTAVGLAMLAESGMLNPWLMVFLCMLASAARSLEMASRQSWLPKLVDAEYETAAAGFMTLAFHVANMIAPAMACFLLCRFDASVVFSLNAIFTFLLIAACTVMESAPLVFARPPHVVRHLREGFRYLCGKRELRLIIISVTLSGILVRPYVLVLPVYVAQVMHAPVFALALAFFAAAAGGAAGIGTTAYLGSIQERLRLWLISGITYGASEILIGVAHDFSDALPWIFLAGYTALVYIGSTNILVRNLVSEEMRSRAVLVTSSLFLVTAPLGIFVYALLGLLFDVRGAFIFGGAAFAIVLLALYGKNFTENR